MHHLVNHTNNNDTLYNKFNTYQYNNILWLCGEGQSKQVFYIELEHMIQKNLVNYARNRHDICDLKKGTLCEAYLKVYLNSITNNLSLFSINYTKGYRLASFQNEITTNK